LWELRRTQAHALIEVINLKEKSSSSVLGNDFKTSVMYAALVNGEMGHIFDFDDAIASDNT